MSGIELNPDALKGLVEKALLDSITPEAREQLVTDAIKHLLEEQTQRNGYPSYGKSRLQEAFESAVHTVTHEVVREAVQNDPDVQAKIRELVSPSIVALCSGNYDGLPEKIGAAISSWLQSRDKY